MFVKCKGYEGDVYYLHLLFYVHKIKVTCQLQEGNMREGQSRGSFSRKLLLEGRIFKKTQPCLLIKLLCSPVSTSSIHHKPATYLFNGRKQGIM